MRVLIAWQAKTNDANKCTKKFNKQKSILA